MNIGVADIGGTFIKYGLFREDSLIFSGEIPTRSSQGGMAVVETAAEALASLSPLDCIGISTAGQVDTRRGIIKYANPNIPGYTGTPVRELLQERFGVGVYVENDVNAAAVGEATQGAAQGVDDFLCLTYGTGIGGAVYIGGSLYRGQDFSAGEVGHLITHGEALLGKDAPVLAGAYETYASTTALVKAAQKLDSILTDGRRILAALHRPEVRQVVDRWIDEILLGLAGLIYTFNPRLIVLGGGIMEAPYVLQSLRSRLPHFVLPGHLPVTLTPARLGNRAALIGAARLALENL